MADDEIQGFAGLGSLKDAMSGVLGSTDEVADVVGFIREHGDDIVDLVRKLPDLLASTAEFSGESCKDTFLEKLHREIQVALFM